MGGDGHDALTFSGQNVLGAGELRTSNDVEDVFVNGPIVMQSGTIALQVAQSLEVNADVTLGSGSVELMAGRDVFGNCSLIQAGDANVNLVSATGIGNVRVQTTGNVALNGGSGGIIGCTGEIAVQANTLTLDAGSSVGTALLTAGEVAQMEPLRISVDMIQGTVGGMGIFLLNDRPLTDIVELTSNAPMGIRRVCDPTTCGGSESEASPLQNTVNQLDVNNDGSVSPIDVLMVVNYLNSAGVDAMAEAPNDEIQPVAPRETDLKWMYVDVNGDRSASALDALLIINHLNRQTTVQSEGGWSLDSRASSNAQKDDAEQSELTDFAASAQTAAFPAMPWNLQAACYLRTRLAGTVSKDDESGQTWETLLDELAADAGSLAVGVVKQLLQTVP